MPSDDKSLKQVAKETKSAAPSQLGDPVSLKAETSSTQPTDQDKPNEASSKSGGGQTLKEKAEQKLKSNPSALGDPISLKAETSDTEPTPDDRGARGTSKTGKNDGKPKM
ncbi:hypothetical protein LTR86_005576 [Recurvomyces mirabilis]|nr:hypothetical protein LTR86_005576 [Recurvomyces mirabilis]